METDKQFVQISERWRFLRLVAGDKRLDKERNADIREDFNIFRLNERVTDYRNKNAEQQNS